MTFASCDHGQHDLIYHFWEDFCTVVAPEPDGSNLNPQLRHQV
jgi:hypothetical protein